MSNFLLIGGVAGVSPAGRVALIGPQTLVVAIASEPKLYDKIGSNMVEVKSRGAIVVVCILLCSTKRFDSDKPRNLAKSVTVE